MPGHEPGHCGGINQTSITTKVASGHLVHSVAVTFINAETRHASDYSNEARRSGFK